LKNHCFNILAPLNFITAKNGKKKESNFHLLSESFPAPERLTWLSGKKANLSQATGKTVFNDFF
jgi:hypothetical protein